MADEFNVDDTVICIDTDDLPPSFLRNLTLGKEYRVVENNTTIMDIIYIVDDSGGTFGYLKKRFRHKPSHELVDSFFIVGGPNDT